MIVSAPELRQFLELCIGELPEAQFIGRVIDGRVVGAVAFFNQEWASVEIAYAGEPGWMTPALVRLCAEYVYGVLGCNRCTARIEASNTYSIHLAKKAGFVQEGRIRGLKNGRDVIVFGMLKEECRWYGRRKRRAYPDGKPVADDRSKRAGQPSQHQRPVRVADVRNRPRRPADVHDPA